MCRSVLLFLLLHALVISTLGLPASPLPKLIRSVKPSVVTIDVFSSDKKFLESGSGFFIANDVVVSSRHVFFKSDRKHVQAHFAQLRTNDRWSAPKEYVVKSVILDDFDTDVIVVEVKSADQNQAFVPLASESPEEGEDIFVVSSPQGLEGVVTTGIISAIHNDIDVQISASIGKGSSGAPVFNYNGEVVGVVNGYLTSGQNMNFAISAQRLRQLLARLPGDTGLRVDDGDDNGIVVARANVSVSLPDWIARQDNVSSMPATTLWNIEKIFWGWKWADLLPKALSARENMTPDAPLKPPRAVPVPASPSWPNGPADGAQRRSDGNGSSQKSPQDLRESTSP